MAARNDHYRAYEAASIRTFMSYDLKNFRKFDFDVDAWIGALLDSCILGIVTSISGV
jgi:hypothetical protein